MGGHETHSPHIISLIVLRPSQLFPIVSILVVAACFASIVLANPAHVCQLKPCHWLILVVEVHLLSFLWAWCDKSPKMSFMASHEVCNTVASAVCLWKYGSYFQIRWWVMNFPLQKRLILGGMRICAPFCDTPNWSSRRRSFIYKLLSLTFAVWTRASDCCHRRGRTNDATLPQMWRSIPIRHKGPIRLRDTIGIITSMIII